MWASAIPYSICIIAVLYIMVSAYIRLKMKFWYTQPVFHIYNIWHWLRPAGVIFQDLPPMNKYVNIVEIKTINIAALEDIKCNQISCFIKNNYNQSKHIKYNPTKRDIFEYLQGTNHPSFFTIQEQPKILFEKGEAISSIPEIVSVISARVLYVAIKGMPSFPTYYVDNLCIHAGQRKKGIAAQMIQTHAYNLRQANARIKTCLFKREGDLTAIVPLTTYRTTSFDLAGVRPAVVALHAALTLIEIGLPQLNMAMDFIQAQTGQFQCAVLPDITNLANIVKANTIAIYGLVVKGGGGGGLQTLYVFHNTRLYYGEKQAVECVATIKAQNCDNALFVAGFYQALFKVQEKNRAVSILMLEDTAHSNILYKNLVESATPLPILFQTPTAFFLYNYSCHTVAHSDCFFLY